MIRFARHPDGVVGVDVRAALPGRGAWTCANPACVQRAVEKGGLLRAFEEAIVVDKEALCLEVDRVFSQEAQRGLSIARRMGRLWPGRTEALDAVRRTPGKVALVIAGDLAERSRQDVERDLPEGVLVCLGGTKDEMGHALGRRPTGVLALALGPQATALVSDLSRLAQFRGTTSGGRGPTSTGPDSTESKTGAAPAGTGSLAPEPTRGESAPESASAKSGIPRVAVRSRPLGTFGPGHKMARRAQSEISGDRQVASTELHWHLQFQIRFALAEQLFLQRRGGLKRRALRDVTPKRTSAADRTPLSVETHLSRRHGWNESPRLRAVG